MARSRADSLEHLSEPLGSVGDGRPLSGGEHTQASLRTLKITELNRAATQLGLMVDAHESARTTRWRRIDKHHKYAYFAIVAALNLATALLTALAEVSDKGNTEYLNLYLFSLDKNLVLDGVANLFFVILLLPLARQASLKHYAKRHMEVPCERNNFIQWVSINEDYHDSSYLGDVRKVQVQMRWHHQSQVTRENLTDYFLMRAMALYNSKVMKTAVLAVLPRMIKHLAAKDAETLSDWDYPVEVAALFTMLMFHQVIRQYVVTPIVKVVAALAYQAYALGNVAMVWGRNQMAGLCQPRATSGWHEPASSTVDRLLSDDLFDADLEAAHSPTEAARRPVELRPGRYQPLMTRGSSPPVVGQAKLDASDGIDAMGSSQSGIMVDAFGEPLSLPAGAGQRSDRADDRSTADSTRLERSVMSLGM